MLRRGVVTVLSSLALVAAAVPAAWAEDGTGVGNCADERFCVEVNVPKTPGGGGGNGPGPTGTGNGTGGGGEQVSAYCAIRRLEPQPPAGSSLWEGHSPGDGAVYVDPCLTSDPNGTATVDLIGKAFWSKDTPAPAVDPAVLAQRAVDSMLLQGPAIVSPRADGTYTVGVPVWMWVGQSQTTWGPNSASATAGGITVTATAKVSRVVWNMGDGSSVTCTGPGTAYTASRGMASSPDCGHLYKATSAGIPGAKYQGTATSTWSIDWAVTGGGGQTGQLTEVRQSAFTVAVGELQVVGQ
ncbi:ATP/GTP-binding protein [Streptomyces sp. NPDC058279]|uniref:ATP/GTP-binding protein n=1 Tax=Streptomyces sp. NPDC058279 TaxID=3346418 RepID=UPI0036EDD93F